MAIAYVNSNGVTPQVDPRTLSVGPVTASNTLIAVFVFVENLTEVVGITDAHSNDWSLVVKRSVGGQNFEVWKAVNVTTAASLIVTADFNRTPDPFYPGMSIGQFSGMTVPTNGEDNTLTVSASETPLRCATLTTTRAGVILTILHRDNTSLNNGWNDGFAELNNFSASLQSTAAYRVTTGGVSAAPTQSVQTATTGRSLTVVVYGTNQKIVSSVFGVTGTVTAPRAVLFSLDNAVNTHSTAGQLKICGDFEVTGTSTIPGMVSNLSTALDGLGT